MSVIAINGDNTIPQPSQVKEEILRHVYDRTSINGVTRRVWYADKKQTILSFSAINTSQYNQLAAYIFNRANPVTYTNAVTGFNFTGYTTAGEDVFIPGNQWLKNITVTITEI